jgi:hypothetical protein
VLAAALAGGALIAVPATAEAAATATATASGSVGEVDVVLNGVSTGVAPVAACDTNATPRNSTAGVDAGSTAKYGSSITTCGRAADGTVGAEVAGRRFQTDVLRRYGGPAIRVGTYTARCNTTAGGIATSVGLGGVNGVALPAQLPVGYTVRIPGGAGAPPLAEVVLNEMVAADPADGGVTVHAMHIKLFPNGGPGRGDIYVGSARCDPYGAP